MIKFDRTHILRMIDVDLLNARVAAGDKRTIDEMEADDTRSAKRLV